MIILTSYISMFQIMNVKPYTLLGKPIRVACVGDSITQGSGYPAKLQLLLGTNYCVANFGVSGSTVTLNSTKPYMNQTAFQKAEQFNPTIVIIMLGTNDARTNLSQNEDEFENDYYELISSFQSLDSNPDVIVVKSPPIFTDNPEYNNTFLDDNVLPQIDNVATNLSLTTVDVNSAFTNHSDYFMDGVHPNDDGAALIASEVDNAIITQESFTP
jgi:acyl-CoA thioesterase I